MPIIKSAKKRMRQAVAQRARNQNSKRSLRVETKEFAAAVAAKDIKKAAESLKKVQSNIDKAVKKDILKKNTAARKLARLSAQAKAIGVKPSASAPKKATPARKPAIKTATAKTAAKTPAEKVAVKKPAAKATAKKAAPKKPAAKK